MNKGISRRLFIKQIGLGTVGVSLSFHKVFGEVQDRLHRPVIDVPILAQDGSAVPVKVSLDHPMERDHFIQSFELSIETDPVPSKGKFFFSPANGQASLAFQMRSGVGGLLKVVGECSRHGRFVGTAELRVVGGGCTAAPEKIEKERLGNPMIRLPNRFRSGDIVEARVKIDHNSSTGLIEKGGKIIRERPEFYLQTMKAHLGSEQVSEFRMTSAVSPNPLIRFPLRIQGPSILRVVFRNSEGQEWSASHPIQPAA